MIQFEFGRHNDSRPGFAAIVGSHHQRINHHVFVDERPDNKTAFFVGKPNAQKFRRAVSEILWVVNFYLALVAPAVAGREHFSAGDDVAIVVVAKINFIDVFNRAD